MLIINVLKKKNKTKKYKNKKGNFVRSSLQKNTKKSKEQQQVLRSIGLPSKAA